MKYAIISDLHSAFEETKAVLKDIKKQPEKLEIVALGDLFECVIGKRKLATLTEKLPLEKAAIYKKKFVELLTFPSIIGNQEERIALVTGDKKFLNYPQTIKIGDALLMHGHQFDYTEAFELIHPKFDEKILFFGHSHRSAIYLEGKRKQIEFDKSYELNYLPQVIVNVGSVIDNLEWCIFDSHTNTVTFKKTAI